MMPSIKRTIEKLEKLEYKDSVPIHEFRSTLLKERIRKEDVSKILKELKTDGVLDIKHGKIKLR